MENSYKPSFILVNDIDGVSRSINLANITKMKMGNWPKALSRREEIKDCILIEINQTYTIACEEKDNVGLLDFLHSLIVADFRNKKKVPEEMFDEKGGIVW